MSSTDTGEVCALRLYVAAGSPNSIAALANVRAVLDEQGLPAEVLEIVDVFDAPERALEDGVVVTPMLVRRYPGKTRRLVGTLRDREELRELIGGDDG